MFGSYLLLRSIFFPLCYLDSREHESELDSRAYEAVKGSLSTKITSVIQCLKKIQVSYSLKRPNFAHYFW